LFLSRASKVLLITAVVVVVTTVMYAYAAGNVVFRGKAGDGRGSIIGYSVVPASVVYTLNASTPQNIDSVAFTTTTVITSGSTVRIKLVAAGSTWYTCTVAGSTNVTCTTSGASVSTADGLRVVIAD
jgi:hypothetical protein